MKKVILIIMVTLLVFGFAFTTNSSLKSLTEVDSSKSLNDKSSDLSEDIPKPVEDVYTEDFSDFEDYWDVNDVQDFQMSDSPGEDYANNVDIFVYNTDPIDFSGSDITNPRWTFYLTGEQFLTYDYMETGICTDGNPGGGWSHFTVLNQYSDTYDNDSFTENLSSYAGESEVYIGFYQHTSSVVVYPGYDIDTCYVFDNDYDPLIWGDEFNSGRTYESYGKWTRVNEGTEPGYDWWGPYWDGSTYDVSWQTDGWETPDDEGGYNHYHDSEPGVTDSRFCNYPYDESYCDNGDFTYMAMNTGFDLSGYEAATLTWWQRGVTEDSYDSIEVDISTDGGSSWTNIYSEYLDTGPWVEESLSLDSYLGEGDVRLRYKMNMDGSICYDGWYVDDILVEGTPTNIQSTSLGSIKTMFE